MSVFVPIPNAADVEVMLELYARPLELNLHFLKDPAPPLPADFANLAVRVGSWFAFGPLVYLSQDVRFISVVVRDASVFGSEPFIDSTFARAGGVATATYPASVAAVISFQAGIHSGVSRNRNYLPGVPLGSLAGSYLPRAFIGHLEGAYGDLVDQARLNLWTWVGVHRYAGSTPLSEGIVSPISHARFQRITVGQQRGRLHNVYPT